MTIPGISENDFLRLSSAEQEEAKRLNREVMQWHHDIYIARLRVGLITPEQEDDLTLAQMREQNGEVDPLEEGKEVEIIEELERQAAAEKDYQRSL